MKTICIYHSRDLDGWMSAAIVKKHHLDYLHNKVEGNTLTNTIDFIGYDYGDTIPDLSEYDKIIMCDVSFPKEIMLDINKRLGVNFVWIDHHQRIIDEVNQYIIDNGIQMEGLVTEPGELKAACELTWMYFFPNEEMPEIVRLLGRYDCFGHKGTNEEQKVLEFQYGARQIIDDYHKAYMYLQASFGDNTIINNILSRGECIYMYLCTEAKQTYSKSFSVQFYSPDESRRDENNCTPALIHKFLCVNQERFNPVNFGIDYHKDEYDGFACFWYKNSKWNFSLYNDNGEVDCSEIAKQFGGGGHKGASGFMIDNLDKVFNK